ncbi:sigma-70 family RNA polymerase sigma factor [Stakelama sp. CBK3Z-3]|uniref:Sigma-70 family RNA polymerase sigma factor n=1 Tax=Stakelama flava TaxID=2860338 RepID=A0ABS6XJT5_9SPHN|nr:sigma-70 family RNA polymerase sigma factor [Stakelama flava]MBW4330474.1 sigma-70 family RNA polymerase sigma factor [Stakelama flava]
MVSDRTSSDHLIAELDHIGTGDREALRRLYEATSARLFGICVHILKDRELAEDALQEVYLKIWNRAGRYDRNRASPLTWLSVIARNTSLDLHRGVLRQPAGSADAIGALVDTDRIADIAMEEKQQHDRLFECLDELPQAENAAIAAAFLDGCTHSELASRQSVALGTMKSWIRRGLIRLRKCLGDD